MVAALRLLAPAAPALAQVQPLVSQAHMQLNPETMLIGHGLRGNKMPAGSGRLPGGMTIIPTGRLRMLIGRLLLLTGRLRTGTAAPVIAKMDKLALGTTDMAKMHKMSHSRNADLDHVEGSIGDIFARSMEPTTQTTSIH